MFQDDPKKLTDSRKNPLQDEQGLQVTVPLRDQIPAKLLKKLNDQKFGVKVVEAWRAGNAHRREWLQRQRDYLADWDEHLVPTAEGAFAGSSNLHVPMPMIVAKAVHARFLQAVLEGDPTAKPRTEASVAASRMVQDLMGYTLGEWANYRQGIAAVMDSWLWDWITTGCGILKIRWDRRFQRFMDVVQVPRKGPTRFVRDNLGVERAIGTIQLEEQEQMVTRLVFEGPVFKDCRAEDVLIVGGDGDPQLSDSVTESCYLTSSEILALADQKIFDSDVAQEVLRGGPDHEYENSGIKEDRSLNAGQAGQRNPSELDRYHILEDYRSAVIDESGLAMEVVCWIHERSQKILRATYLHRINKAGERPFFKADWHKRPGQIYGTGLVEMLHPLSVEMDAMHNMRIDFGLFATMPFGLYRSTSGINPETLRIEPGALIPVDNPAQDIVFPNLGNRTSFGFQEEAALQTMVERISSVNDLTTGVLTGAQGATRTATGVRGLLGEQNANLDVHLRRLNRAWKQAIEYLLHLLQQRIPRGFEYRVTAETGDYYFSRIQTPEQIMGDFDFELSPNSANTNKAIQQQDAMEILNLALNPLLIQTGIVNASGIYEAVKNLCRSKNIRDFSRFFVKPAGHQVQLSPMEEVSRILSGQMVPVTMEMDHQGFLQFYEEVLKNEDTYFGQFSPEAVQALEAQAQAHVQMAQALAQAQAQAANLMQQRQNAATSQAQAPTGLQPFAGSEAV